MTKQQIIQEIRDLPYVKKIISVELSKEIDTDIKLYRVRLLEVDGKEANERTIEVYVIKEGLPAEEVFYKGQEPRKMVATQFAQKAIEGKQATVVQSGEDWAVIENVDVVNGEMVKTLEMVKKPLVVTKETRV